MIDITDRTTYSFEYVNRPETVGNPAGKSLAYEFYSNGLRKHLTDPDSGLNTYIYDAASHLKTLTNPHSKVTTFTYDTLGAGSKRNLTTVPRTRLARTRPIERTSLRRPIAPASC